MKRNLVLALALAAGACVADQPEIETSQEEILGGFFGETVGRSGGRLTAQYLLSEDGARHFFQMWDTELDTACNFSEAPDGQLRCFPEKTYSLVYTDSDCTQPGIEFYTLTDEATAPGVFSAFVEPETCGPMERVSAYEAYRVVEELDETTVYRSLAPGLCSPSSSLPAPWIPHVFAVEATGSDALVGGHVAHRFAGGLRLFERVVEGDDHSRSPMNGYSGSFARSYYDWVLDASVTAAVTSRGGGVDEDVVWADGTASKRYFADATCSRDAVEIRGCADRVDPIVVDTKGTLDESSCRQVYSHNSIAPLEGDSIYFGAGPQCFQLPPSLVTSRTAAVGGAFDSGGLVVGATGLSASWRRLQSIVYNNSDLSNLPIGFYDSYAGARCDVTHVQPGEYACVPQSTPGASLYFRDDACTQPLIARAGPAAAVETHSCYAGDVVVFDVDTAAGTMAAYAAGAPVQLPAPDPDAPTAGNAYAMGSHGCTATTVSAAMYEGLPAGELDLAMFHLTDF